MGTLDIEKQYGPGDIVHEPRGVGMGYVYLLHFDRPISDDSPAQHYVGWTGNLVNRMKYHAQGRGARFTQVAKERGISFKVVRVWKADRDFERWVKNCHCTPRFCPVCSKGRRDAKMVELTIEEIEKIFAESINS